MVYFIISALSDRDEKEIIPQYQMHTHIHTTSRNLLWRWGNIDSGVLSAPHYGGLSRPLPFSRARRQSCYSTWRQHAHRSGTKPDVSCHHNACLAMGGYAGSDIDEHGLSVSACARRCRRWRTTWRTQSTRCTFSRRPATSFCRTYATYSSTSTAPSTSSSTAPSDRSSAASSCRRSVRFVGRTRACWHSNTPASWWTTVVTAGNSLQCRRDVVIISISSCSRSSSGGGDAGMGDGDVALHEIDISNECRTDGNREWDCPTDHPTVRSG